MVHRSGLDLLTNAEKASKVIKTELLQTEIRALPLAYLDDLVKLGYGVAHCACQQLWNSFLLSLL